MKEYIRSWQICGVRDCHVQGKLVESSLVRKEETGKGDHHDDAGAGDDAAGAGKAVEDAEVVRRPFLPVLQNPDKQENVVLARG